MFIKMSSDKNTNLDDNILSLVHEFDKPLTIPAIEHYLFVEWHDEDFQVPWDEFDITRSIRKLVDEGKIKTTKYFRIASLDHKELNLIKEFKCPVCSGFFPKLHGDGCCKSCKDDGWVYGRRGWRQLGVYDG